MRKSLLAAIAGAALIAGGDLAAAQQRMDDSLGGASGAQGSSQRELGGAAHERQPGAMPGQAQGRVIEEKEHRTLHSDTMQGQGRSGAIEEKEHRSGQTRTMQGEGRTGAVEEKERRSGHPGAMQGQGRSSAIEEKERRSGQVDAVQSPPEGRSGRSVGFATLSPDQKTRLHEVITGENVQRVNHADFALSVGTRVPNTVTFYDVPDTIVDILPQYRGFEYIIVRDDLVIIDPETLEIVAVLPV
jgi:Protein of unknown function (DUF1236)